MDSKIPYGVSNFAKLRSQNYLYVDKTKYIEILEGYGESYIFFLRPRRFGKSLFVSLLSHYYDIATRDQFAELFKGLYIGEKPTSLANTYYILHFNFSSITTSQQDKLVEGFTQRLLEGLDVFCHKYNLAFEYKKAGMPAEILSSFLSKVGFHINGKIYVLIDEYDHFADELLSFQVEVFEETISRTGFVRKWFEALKIGTESIVDRIFVTGVSPITLNSLTSGFNIAKNKTRDPNLNEMMGFTEEEVCELSQAVLGELGKSEEVLQQLKDYYNGYLFSEDAFIRVFNSDMVLYYLTEYLLTHRPPKDLIDTNISSDYSKLQKLFTLKNQERNFRILENILANEPQLIAITREFSLAKEFTEEDFLSLLYYLGFLTIDQSVLNLVYLKVPNYAVKELYFNFFTQVLKEQSAYELETTEVRKSVLDIASQGKLDGFISFVEAVLHGLSNRDFIKFDEKYIKFVILTYLGLSKIYNLKSEYEVNDGYIDIAFFKRNPKEDIYEGVLELKYIKQKDYEKQGERLVEQTLKAAKEQLRVYCEAPELKGKKKLLKGVLVFVGDSCVAKENFCSENIDE